MIETLLDQLLNNYTSTGPVWQLTQCKYFNRFQLSSLMVPQILPLTLLLEQQIQLPALAHGAYVGEGIVVNAIQPNATLAAQERVWLGKLANVTKSQIFKDGSATFAGEVSANTGAFSRDVTNNNVTILYAGNDNGIKFAAKGNGTYIGTSLTNINNATPTGSNIILSTDGTSTFAGKLQVNNQAEIYRPAAAGGSTSGNTLVQSKSDVGGTAVTKASITTDGSAAFSSSITAQNTILANRTGSTQTAFQATLSGVTKVDIKAGGAATFAGTVKSGALDLSNTSAAGIEVRSTGEILIQRPSSQGTSSIIDGRLGNTQNVNILGNGDATFKGKLDVGQTYTGAEIARFGKTATGATSYLAFHTENANYAFIGTGDQLIAGGGASDFGIRAQGNILFSSGGNSERMRIDSSGRVLIGTLTEGYSDADDLTVAASGNAGITIRSGTTNAGAIYFSSGTSGNSEYRGYIEYSQNSAFLRFGTAAAEQMRIDSAGRLLIGTTAGAAGRIVHASNSGNNSAYFHSTNGSSGTGSQDGIVMGMGDATNAYFWNYENGNTVFATNGAERMRLTNNTDGQLLIGTTSGSNSSGIGVKLRGGGAATVDVVTNASTNINLHHVYNINSNNNGYRYYLSIDGGIRNHSNNNTNLSDEREKKNIVDMDSTWSDLKQWSLRQFHFNSQDDSEDKNYGVIAQQIEPITPQSIYL